MKRSPRSTACWPRAGLLVTLLVASCQQDSRAPDSSVPDLRADLAGTDLAGQDQSAPPRCACLAREGAIVKLCAEVIGPKPAGIDFTCASAISRCDQDSSILTPCDLTGALGGCRDSHPPDTMTLWYYPSSATPTVSAVQAACAALGAQWTFVTP